MSTELKTNDIPQAIKIMKDLKVKSRDVMVQIQSLIKRVKEGDINTTKGISFLEVKNHVLLSYLINLSHILLQKTSGKSIEGSDDILRLVELRTVLEKMRPIDQKLKYQIDKLIKTATTGSLAADDPLRYKPNPENLESKFDDQESGSSDDEDETKEKKPKLYRPPKLAAMHYDGDDTLKIREEKRLERAKKRALGSSVIQELRQEYDEGPEEIRDDADLHRAKVDRNIKDRTRYEEDNFVRMQLTKKDVNAMKKVRTMSSLDELTRFGDIRALTGEGQDAEDDERPRKKRKLSKKGKGKGKKKGRKFRKM